jgi:hypothetical protein
MSGYTSSRNYRRRGWPPHATVEDEQEEDSVPCRGTIDQQTVLEFIETEKRFVLLTGPSRSTSNASKRPHSAKEQERTSRKTDRLDPNDDLSPLLTQRIPSPYSFARTQTGSLASEDKTKIAGEQKSRPDKKSTNSNSKYSDEEYEPSSSTNKGKQRNVAFHDRPSRDSGSTKHSESHRPPRLDTSSKRPVTPLEIPRDPIIDIINNAGPKLTQSQTAQTPKTPRTPRGSIKDNENDYWDSRHHSLPSKPPPLTPVGDSRGGRGDRSPRPGPKSSAPYPDFDDHRGGSKLPYPDASHPMVMPDEHHFISDLLANAEAEAPSKPNRTAAPPIARSNSKRKVGEPSSPVTNRNTPSSSQGSNRLSGSALTLLPIPKELKDIPPCPRNFFSREEHTWHQPRQIKEFDVCTTCFGNMVLPTKFRHDFHIGRRYNSNMPIQCDFGDVLVRQAWLMTLKENWDDLSLLSRLAKITASNKRFACPNKSPATGPWFVIQDEKRRLVEGFQICPTDKAAIEELFPAMKGWFVPASASLLPTLCSLRSSSRRSVELLHMLESVQQRAFISLSSSDSGRTSNLDLTRMPNHVDLTPLLTLIRRNSRVPECPRDCATSGLLWHFPFKYPEFPVCPECYKEVIADDAKAGRSLAVSFTSLPRSIPSNAQAKLAPGSLHGISDGFTCCLYSDRMRDIWRDAVQIEGDGALKLWVREVKERRRKELDYASWKADLLKRAGSVRSELLGAYTGKDETWIRDQYDHVEEAWAKVE